MGAPGLATQTLGLLSRACLSGQIWTLAVAYETDPDQSSILEMSPIMFRLTALFFSQQNSPTSNLHDTERHTLHDVINSPLEGW